MMGMQIEPAQLFYEFRLDEHVPSDHAHRRHLLAIRLRLRSGAGSLHLSRRQAAGAVPPALCDAAVPGIAKDGTRLYRASKRDYDAFSLKARCCPNTPARKIPRDLDEDAPVARGHGAGRRAAG